jgi:hypothetical protein
MKTNPNYQNDLLGFPNNLLDNVYVIKNESASDHVEDETKILTNLQKCQCY